MAEKSSWITNWTLAGEKPYNQGHGRRNHFTSRKLIEWGEDVRGLAGLHRWQLRFQRDITVARGSPLRSGRYKPQARLPNLQHQSHKGTQITPSCEKHQGFCPPGRDCWRHRLLKGQCTKFHLQPLTIGSGKGRQSLGLVALGRELKKQPSESLYWVILHPSEAIFLRQKTEEK